MSAARLKAKSLISTYEINDPQILVENLEDFCAELNAPVKYEPLDGAEARIVALNGKGLITINSEEARKERVRFSIGHELGHFFLHCHEISEFNCSRKDMGDWFQNKRAINRELEANEFSIELLIPETLAKPLVIAKKPSIEAIEEISRVFQMSLSASARRYVELSDEPVAVVFYSSTHISSNAQSEYFRQQEYWFESGPLDKESLAHDAVKGTSYQRMMSVAASAWLKLPGWLEDETLMEQTRFFPNYKFGMSLLWLKNGPLIRN